MSVEDEVMPEPEPEATHPGQEHQFLVTVVLDLPPEADSDAVQAEIKDELIQALWTAKAKVEEKYTVGEWWVDG